MKSLKRFAEDRFILLKCIFTLSGFINLKAICKNQAFRVLENEHSIGNEDLVNATENQNDLFKDASQMCKSISSSTDPKSVSPAPNSSAQNSSAKSKTKKSSTEIKQLFQQHYCSHKNKKKHPIPSAGAIR